MGGGGEEWMKRQWGMMIAPVEREIGGGRGGTKGAKDELHRKGGASPCKMMRRTELEGLN